MNFFLTDIPERKKKPRDSGLTMVMDKGLGLDETKNLIQVCGNYIDIIKLGFGTSAISQDIEKKIKLYRDSKIKVHLGGTLFEAFIIRNMYNDYKKLLRDWQIEMCEVSDGSINIDHKKKCEYIKDLSKEFLVVSEVGSKNNENNLSSQKWSDLMQEELRSGSWKVITEAREGGNTGIFSQELEVKSDIISQIIKKIPIEKILWESPLKHQQVWFIKQFGANVNLGNISPNDVIPLETLRIGLRGDTFFEFIGNNSNNR